jgi:hypothetical protein
MLSYKVGPHLRNPHLASMNVHPYGMALGGCERKAHLGAHREGGQLFFGTFRVIVPLRYAVNVLKAMLSDPDTYA